LPFGAERCLAELEEPNVPGEGLRRLPALRGRRSDRSSNLDTLPLGGYPRNRADWQLNTWLYYTDVNAQCGPTHVMPRSAAFGLQSNARVIRKNGMKPALPVLTGLPGRLYRRRPMGKVEVRDVTKDEVEFYAEHGWVMLRGLFGRTLAAELLAAARRALAERSEEVRQDWQASWSLAAEGVEPFRTTAFSTELGRVAQRLINRRRLCGVDHPIRFGSDVVFRKGPGVGATPFHQDAAVGTADRIGRFNMWVALDEVTPEMGAMRFLSGSHREGLLGDTVPENERGVPYGDRDFLREHYPRLWELYELSPPFHYRPGDATVHTGYMLHGAPPNETDRDRWSYLVEYEPVDVRYRGSLTVDDDGAVADYSTPVDPVRKPIVYGGAS
jgi:ectoine hydroxylase-related dioxygenase (phytanoyl-CoA dioxygenase family)